MKLTWDFTKPMLLVYVQLWLSGYYVVFYFFAQFSSFSKFSIFVYLLVSTLTISVAVITVGVRCSGIVYYDYELRKIFEIRIDGDMFLKKVGCLSQERDGLFQRSSNWQELFLKTMGSPLRSMKCSRFFALLFLLLMSLQYSLQAAETSTDRDVELEIWIADSNSLVVDRQIISHENNEELTKVIASFYESNQSVMVTLTTDCDTNQLFLAQVLEVFDKTGLVAAEVKLGARKAYTVVKQCGQPANRTTRIEEYVLHSNNTDTNYIITITFPDDYSPENSYPLLVFTDANANYFSKFWDDSNNDGVRKVTENLLANGTIPKVVIVGIGYWGRDRRNRDFTPELPGRPNTTDSGGALEFAAFIESELKPFVYSKAQVDRSNETYLGHSLGGLFGAYALFNHSDLFDNYVLSSPSFWYGNGLISNPISFAFEEQYSRKNTDMPKSVYISIGSSEIGTMISEAKEMYEVLSGRNYKSLKLEFGFFQGEGHISVVEPAYTEGLAFVFRTSSLEYMARPNSVPLNLQ